MNPIEGKIPTRLAFVHGLGSIAYGVKDNGFSTFLLLFYNQVLGMDAKLVGAGRRWSTPRASRRSVRAIRPPPMLWPRRGCCT